MPLLAVNNLRNQNQNAEEMTSREELLALAAQLDADGASQHVVFEASGAPEQQPASEAAQRRQRACELVRANEAARLLGLLTSPPPPTSSSSTAAAAAAAAAAALPAWPRSELPVPPAPKSLKRSANPTPKVPRAVRNGVIARLAAEHALLLAAAAAAEPAPKSASAADSSSASASAPASSASSLTSLLVEAVRSSPSLRRAAAALALKQEEASVFGPSTGKETYLSRARATTALSARTSAAEVSAAALQLAANRKRKGGGEEEGDGGGSGEEKREKREKRNPAPDPNPTPLPLLRRREQMEREEKERKEREEEARRREPQQPLQQLEEAEIDWEAAAAEPQPQRNQQPRAAAAAALPSPRSAISAVVSAALAPFVDNKQVSKEAADSAAARAVSKVLGSFLVSPLAARAERKKGRGGGEKEKDDALMNAAVAAFLTDSQRGRIAAFARRCLDAEERRREAIG